MEILPPAPLLSPRAAGTLPSYGIVEDLTQSLLGTSSAKKMCEPG